MDAIAASGTVAVLLPGAFYYLREKQAPPVAALRKAGVPMAVATDLNPGTSPVHSILTAMNMACVLFGLTPEEALRGVTDNAAKALGLYDRGLLTPGMRADIALWNAERPGDLAYPLGFNPLAAVIHNGDAGAGDPVMSDAQPLYAKVKEHILDNIRSGAWEAGRRVPSENELVESFGISRMTANRALRELTVGRLPQPRARRRHLRQGSPGAVQPHGAPQHRRGDRPARPPLFLAPHPQGHGRRQSGAGRGVRGPRH